MDLTKGSSNGSSSSSSAGATTNNRFRELPWRFYPQSALFADRYTDYPTLLLLEERSAVRIITDECVASNQCRYYHQTLLPCGLLLGLLHLAATLSLLL
jgi:hypothetical protein